VADERHRKTFGEDGTSVKRVLCSDTTCGKGQYGKGYVDENNRGKLPGRV